MNAIGAGQQADPLVGIGAGYLSNAAQNSAYPQGQLSNYINTVSQQFQPKREKEYPEYDISIRGTENGFIVDFEDKTYICTTAIEVSERIAACMVEDKLEK